MSHKILTREEVGCVLSDLRAKPKRLFSSATNLALFSLVCGAGLRVKEAAALSIGEVVTDGANPRIELTVTKGSKRRMVPLTWDRTTLEVLAEYKAKRLEMGGEWFLGTHRLGRRTLQMRWHRIISGSLSQQRSLEVPIHGGRRTYASHALDTGRTLAQVRDALGHASISTTSIYCISIENLDLPDLY